MLIPVTYCGLTGTPPTQPPVVPPPASGDYPTALRPIPANASTFRSILFGTSSYGPLGPGDHVVLANDTYAGNNIVFTASGTVQNPIVIRAENKLGAKFKTPMGIKANNVYVWGLDCTDGRNAYHRADSSIDSFTSDWPFQFGVVGTNVQFWRCKFDWTRIKDTNRGGAPNWVHGIGVGWKSVGFKLLRCVFQFSGTPNLGDIPSTLVQGGGNPIRGVVMFIRENTQASHNWANNKDAEIAYNVFKDFPGDDFFDDIAPVIGGKKLSQYAPYDSIVRGQVFSIGGEQNYSVNGKTSGINIHRNYIENNGNEFDFGAIKCDGQGSCFLDFNTVGPGDGMRLRVCKNWVIRGNYLGAGRGLYGNYGEGHVYIGNYCAKPLGIRSGNCTNASIMPYPPSGYDWNLTGYPAAKGTPQPAAKRNKLYANRGIVYVGWNEYGKSTSNVTTDGTEIYGHMNLDGTQTRTAFNTSDLVDKGHKGSGTLISGNVPNNIDVPMWVRVTEADCGPNSGV